MNAAGLPAPVDRTPAVTVALLEADGPNLGHRLLDVAAQDYAGPLQILAVAAADPAVLGARLAELRWACGVAEAASGSRAIEAALREAQGSWIAFLTRGARPHPLWIHEMVAVAVAHPDAFAVAPLLARGSGDPLAAGLERGPEGAWRGRAVAAEEEEEAGVAVEAAAGDGLLVSAAELRALPLDAELDLRSLGVDLALRARERGGRVYAAPRARVVLGAVPARNGEGRLHLDPRDELLLTARHVPQALPRALGRSPYFAGSRGEEVLELVRQAMARAGLDSGDATARLVAESLAESSGRVVRAEERASELGERAAELERERQENAAHLHREMAWAHELDRRLHDALEALERERADHAAARESLSEEAQRDAAWLRAELAAAREEASVASGDLAAIREQLAEQGDPNDLRARDLEARWKRAEERSESAARELGAARERMRALEQAFHSLERDRSEGTSRRGVLETELQRTRERARRAEETGRTREEELQGVAEERAALLARLRAAEAGFEAAARSLHTNKTEMDRLRGRLAEAETRREAAERSYAELRVVHDASEGALRDLSAELGAERRAEEKGAPGSRGAGGAADLRAEIQILLGMKEAAEHTAADLRLAVDAAEARAEASEQREGALAGFLAEARRQAAETADQNEKLRAERASFLETLAESRSRAESLEAAVAELRGAKESLERDLAAAQELRARLDSQLSEQRAKADEAARRHAGELAAEVERLRATEEALTAVRAALEEQARQSQERDASLSASLAASRAEHAAERARAEGLAAELSATAAALAAVRAALAATQSSLAETSEALASARIALDDAHAALAERRGDLALLRAEMLRESGRAAERIVGLIEEARRRRWRRRGLLEWERAFLTGPGAPYVREPIR